MGMAASQARLLSITSRMADNELRAQIINNSKMRLATESSKVSEDYVTALNSATMMISNYDIDGNSQYQKLSFNSLTSYSSHNSQYGLVNANGQILVSETEASLFKQANGNLEDYLLLHNLQFTSNYFTSSTLGGDIVNVTGQNPNTLVEYQIGSYSVDTLKAMYEGKVDSNGESHLGYNLGLQTSAYVNFSDYFAQFQVAEENYQLKVIEEINKDLFNDGEWDTNFTKYYTNIYENTDVNDLMNNGLFYLVNKLIQLKDQGKLSSANGGTPTTFYDDIMATIETMTYDASNGKVTAHDTDNVTTNNDGSINLGQTIVLEGGTTFNELIAVENKDGTYTIKVNEDAKIYLGGEGQYIQFINDENEEVDSLTVKDLSNFQYVLHEPYQEEDGTEFDDYTIYSYSYTGGDKANVAWEMSLEEIQNTISSLYISYKAGIANSVNKDIYANNANSTDIQDAQKYYNESLDQLINLIFADVDENGNYLPLDKEFKDSIKLNANNLNDVGWIISNYSDKTSEQFNIIKDIYILDSLFNTYGEPNAGWVDLYNEKENADAKVQWYTNLFYRMEEGYKALENGLASSNEWIQFALESGLVSMEQVDKSNNWTSTIYSNVSSITEVTDDVAVARAEAEYKKAMNNIENKDKRFDLELKNIDTEHNSLQTEYDSVKSVIDKNIERSFKMYS